MTKLKVLDLFSGIGGFSLGLERTGGFKTAAFCEIDSYARKVLSKHWPNVPQYDDVRNLTKKVLDDAGITIDVVTGGFPCQDLSVAGKQAGIMGKRSGLWGELCRIIGEVRPQYAIVENVPALLSGERGVWFGKVLGDLAEIGYDAEWHCIPASAVGAHHQRDRVWIVAYPDGLRVEGSWSKQRSTGVSRKGETLAYPSSVGYKGSRLFVNSSDCTANGEGETSQPFNVRIGTEWATEPDVGRVANGVRHRMDRLKCLGNAVVPQIPELIGYAILNYEESKQRAA